ncbi:MAG: OmpH family outer membrane protein [Deltaproteobacteria bacterium]|nr:OmpH family outer membrane protein [Deltaproteobacteria bacterium]
MRRAALVFLTLVLFVLPATTALAAELKIGVVDVEFVIHKSKKGERAKATLKKLFDSKQKELDEAQKKLLALKEALAAGSDMETPEKKKAKVLEYQQGLLQLQELYMKNQQELQKKELDLMKPILKSLEGILTTMAKDGNFDFIMNRSEQGVLFTKPDHDLTQQVLDKLNAS